jgi:phosphate starvation-inducible protein PhoH and related proteins
MRKKIDKNKEQNPIPKTAKSSLDILQHITLDIRPKNETQKKLVHAIRLNDVTVCTGPAGTGKTLVSVFEALLLMKAHPELYKEIKLVKSITQLKNEEIGTLPGDEKEKLKFHMMSFLDAFHKLIGEGLTNKLIDAGMIKMEVFGAIRGRSFSNAIIIIDEFQNISHDNAKTFLTRFSDDTKVVVLGDSGQIDIKNKKDSSLETLVNKVKRFPTDGVEVVEFTNEDIVRHRLTSYFINIFKEETDHKVNPSKPLKPKSQIIKEGGQDRFFSRIMNLFK